MAIATQQTIDDLTSWPADAAAKAADHLHEAEIECKRIMSTQRSRSDVDGSEVSGNATYRTTLDVNEERYDEIVALGSGDKHYTVLQRAEAFMAIYFALPFLNLRPTEQGGLMRAIGIVEGQRDLMANMEMEAYRRTVYNQAYELLLTLIRYSEASEKVCFTL